jgi:hypothetical protein
MRQLPTPNTETALNLCPSVHLRRCEHIEARRLVRICSNKNGFQSFIILRDGAPVGKLPEKTIGRHGRALLQTMSYHDTPEKPLPAMRFVDPNPTSGARYSVIMVNGAGLKSELSRTVSVR